MSTTTTCRRADVARSSVMRTKIGFGSFFGNSEIMENRSKVGFDCRWLIYGIPYPHDAI